MGQQETREGGGRDELGLVGHLEERCRDVAQCHVNEGVLDPVEECWNGHRKALPGMQNVQDDAVQYCRLWLYRGSRGSGSSSITQKKHRQEELEDFCHNNHVCHFVRFLLLLL